MAVSLAQFHKQLAGTELKPVYLLAGEEHLLVLDAADALRARARELGYTEREILDADHYFDWDALARAGASMSLFASRRMIDLRLPTGKAGKEGGTAIAEFCADPPPDTVLLITSLQWSKKDNAGAAWVGAVEKVGQYVPVWPMHPDEFSAWLSQRMAGRGLNPDRAAVQALAERVEGNSLAAAQEIDKLALLHGDAPLDAQTLESLVADSARYDVFKLVDAALGGDAARALRILAGLRAEGDAIPALMGIILYQLQMLARLAAAPNLTSALRSERLWEAREKFFRKVLGGASPGHWEDCLMQAARVDRLSKGRGDGDAWIELERLVVTMAMPRAGFAKAS
ncbi:MAG: DNA polymerase III subunit delta [Xanthomonadaceae bacterium]|nr:DNA polymerase III subunit delta [Xanthomonadaceae bacterium]MDE1885670.1 DNA polymerase III subunit delta [Xanthomonadaceae bacterium]MDE1960032.1 DNA polymerase III subunit delta [Xanthomonadaceae bacterium]MDE2084091.1 DNA polymerase III subunit delta [Xanthomonadaceae bacterium]MDE2256399.1 DNA polymerase III subunit delta [Xanthomonadaceae bacterium]